MVTTTQQLLDRLKRFYYNNYPSQDSVLTDNEVLLYVNDAVASVAVKQANDAYAITGIQEIPDGYVTTFKLTSLTKDSSTGYYHATLPHPPFGLPKGNGINSCFFTGVKGQSKPILYVSANELDFFRNIPHPSQAAYYWVEGSTIYLYVKTNLPTSVNLNVRMATMQTSNLNVPINLPPDAVEMVFNLVIDKLIRRKGIQDDGATDGKDK